jgi:predicted dienelactone hydrolase
MNQHLPRVLAALAALLVAAHAHAFEAGWMQIQVAGTTADAPTMTVALYYPTTVAPRTIAMGPFTVNAAIGAKPVDQVKALILLSHGNAGTELGHSTLAQALARNGYLVARHRRPPGRSGVEGPDRQRWPGASRRRAGALGRRNDGARFGGCPAGCVPDEEALRG